MEVFLEVSESKSYEEWEDNFRRDENPEREIRIWEYIADKYILYSKQFCSIEEKEDLYYLLLTCSSSEKELVLQTLKLNKLSVDNANIVINSYFSNK